MLVQLAQEVDAYSSAYVIGRIVGIVLIVLIVVLFIRSRMNRDE